MPFMWAEVVDKRITSKAKIPFFYGLIALTLVWVSVSKLIRIVTYFFGNVAMRLAIPHRHFNSASLLLTLHVLMRQRRSRPDPSGFIF